MQFTYTRSELTAESYLENRQGPMPEPLLAGRRVRAVREYLRLRLVLLPPPCKSLAASLTAAASVTRRWATPQRTRTA